MRAWMPPSIIECAGSIMYLPRRTLCRASSYKSSNILGSLRSGNSGSTRKKKGGKRKTKGKVTFYVNLSRHISLSSLNGIFSYHKWNSEGEILMHHLQLFFFSLLKNYLLLRKLFLLHAQQAVIMRATADEFCTICSAPALQAHENQGRCLKRCLRAHGESYKIKFLFLRPENFITFYLYLDCLARRRKIVQVNKRSSFVEYMRYAPWVLGRTTKRKGCRALFRCHDVDIECQRGYEKGFVRKVKLRTFTWFARRNVLLFASQNASIYVIYVPCYVST